MKSIINKFSKRITMIFEKITYTAIKWVEILLHQFDITDWNLSKIIISNRDEFFFANLWRAFFEKLKVIFFVLLHTNEQNKRTNQIVEIVL